MLSLLQIKNFALIDYLEFKLSAGLNVLTWETGAGKSSILDAIDIVFGGKVNSCFVRQGCQQATIEATFEVNPSLQPTFRGLIQTSKWKTQRMVGVAVDLPSWFLMV
jgi:DNA repair protein RecN (Recombination protein N)